MSEEHGFPLEHDKRCMCTDPAPHRLVWTNWKLVQAEADAQRLTAELEAANDEIAACRAEAGGAIDRLTAEVARLQEVEAVLRPGAENYNRERLRANAAETRERALVEALNRISSHGQHVMECVEGGSCGEFCPVRLAEAALTPPTPRRG